MPDAADLSLGRERDLAGSPVPAGPRTEGRGPVPPPRPPAPPAGRPPRLPLVLSDAVESVPRLTRLEHPSPGGDFAGAAGGSWGGGLGRVRVRDGGGASPPPPRGGTGAIPSRRLPSSLRPAVPAPSSSSPSRRRPRRAAALASLSSRLLKSWMYRILRSSSVQQSGQAVCAGKTEFGNGASGEFSSTGRGNPPERLGRGRMQ